MCARRGVASPPNTPARACVYTECRVSSSFLSADVALPPPHARQSTADVTLRTRVLHPCRRLIRTKLYPFVVILFFERNRECVRASVLRLRVYFFFSPLQPVICLRWKIARNRNFRERGRVHRVLSTHFIRVLEREKNQSENYIKKKTTKSRLWPGHSIDRNGRFLIYTSAWNIRKTVKEDKPYCTRDKSR